MSNIEAGYLKKGDYIFINNRPTRIVDMSYTRGSRHPAKICLLGIDVFTLKRYELVVKCTATVLQTFGTDMLQYPVMKRNEYDIVNIDDEFVHCIDESGKDYKIVIRQISIDSYEQLKRDHDNGCNIKVSVISHENEIKYMFTIV